MRHDLGRASRITAEALGQPGQRQFRLLLEGTAGTAVLWLEKEQLYHLAIAIKRLLSILDKESVGQEATPSVMKLPENPAFDFKVQALVLGHDPSQGLVLVTAKDTETNEDDPSTVGCWATYQQMSALADQSLEVCAAGRPPCFLCNAPLNPGKTHVCPRANGHNPTS